MGGEKGFLRAQASWKANEPWKTASSPCHLLDNSPPCLQGVCVSGRERGRESSGGGGSVSLEGRPGLSSAVSRGHFPVSLSPSPFLSCLSSLGLFSPTPPPLHGTEGLCTWGVPHSPSLVSWFPSSLRSVSVWSEWPCFPLCSFKLPQSPWYCMETSPSFPTAWFPPQWQTYLGTRELS